VTGPGTKGPGTKGPGMTGPGMTGPGGGDRLGGLRYDPENWWWRRGQVAPDHCVIFDVDGVIADATHRQHLVTGGRKQWTRFFDEVGKDPVIEPVVRMARLLDSSLCVVLLTARPSSVADLTIDWLRRHDVRWDLLVMRDYGDYQLARDFKDSALHELRAYGFVVDLAIEDDERNVAMFERRGVPCLFHYSGYHV
jgi:hypothetical protein